MAKNIIKEIIIVLLLALAIILILGVLLYEYVPANKIIPEKVSYTTPENAKQELETDSNVDDTEVIITYQIDSTDLKNYQKIQEYVPGKKNPFEEVKEEIENIEDENGNTTSDTQKNPNTSESANKNTSSSTNSNTGYLPDKGTK